MTKLKQLFNRGLHIPVEEIVHHVEAKIFLSERLGSEVTIVRKEIFE